MLMVSKFYSLKKFKIGQAFILMNSLHVDFPELEKYMVFYCLSKLENNTVGHFLIC